MKVRGDAMRVYQKVWVDSIFMRTGLFFWESVTTRINDTQVVILYYVSINVGVCARAPSSVSHIERGRDIIQFK